MSVPHPKSIRRRILQILYQRYLNDPREMLSPQDLLADGTIPRENLFPNVHYLYDRQLVELMFSYTNPMFAAVRLTADGVDLVENEFEFNRRFPPAPDDLEQEAAQIPLLVERLIEEADFSPTDGETRRCLLRDVQFLRDELARPAGRWRRDVIRSVLDWIAAAVEKPDEHLPSLRRIRNLILENPQVSRG